MARFVFSFLLLLLSCLCFHAQAIRHIAEPQARDPSNLIAIACKKAIHKQFCINLLTNDRNTAKADLKGFTFIALRAAEKNATATSLFIKQSLSNAGIDSQPELEQALSDCSDHYITAVELIEDSVSALISNDQDDLFNFVKAAMADVDSCDAGLKSHDIVSAEVRQKNSALRQLFSTSLDIADVAKTQN